MQSLQWTKGLNLYLLLHWNFKFSYTSVHQRLEVLKIHLNNRQKVKLRLQIFWAQLCKYNYQWYHRCRHHYKNAIRVFLFLMVWAFYLDCHQSIFCACPYQNDLIGKKWFKIVSPFTLKMFSIKLNSSWHISTTPNTIKKKFNYFQTNTAI